MSDIPKSSVIEMTTDIIAAYVAHNPLPSNDLPDLIKTVHAALDGISSEPAAAQADAPNTATAAQIKKSITPDFLISFEDGKKYRTLKRHLAGHGLTPQSYREKWGLPKDYPMVSPSYSQARSAMAKSLGLGQGGRGGTGASNASKRKDSRS